MSEKEKNSACRTYGTISNCTYEYHVHLQFPGRSIFRSICGASLIIRINRNERPSLGMDPTDSNIGCDPS